MNSNRLAVLSAAFREVPLSCGPYQLRPLTAGSLNLLMDTGNALFAGGDGGEPEQFQALFEFIWIHTAPEDDVIEACEHPELLRTQARKLSLSISFDDLSGFSEKFADLQQRLNAALVEIEPEKGMGKPGGETPRTGLPPSSIRSEAVGTPSGSDGSSGSSRFPGPSSMSTLPTARPEPLPAGRSPIWEPSEEPEDYATPEQVMPLP